MSTEIPNYIIGKKIGEGSFSKVRIASHIPTKKKVAIKILDKQKVFELSQELRKMKQERLKKELIQKQKEDYYSDIQKKNSEWDSLKSLQIESSKEINLADLLKDFVEKNRQLEDVKIPEAEKSNEKKLEFVGNFQVTISFIKNEILLMMRLEHPNIIKLHEIIESEKYTYIVM
jgi:serine/threonine protein kinase